MKILLCPLSDPGYLYPALGVGRRLVALGEDVTVLGNRGAQPFAQSAGLPFRSADVQDGSTGFRVGRWFLDADKQYLNIVRTARELRPDVLLTSVLGLGALLAGEVLDLPVIVLGLAGHIWNYARPVEPTDDNDQRAWRTEQILAQYHATRDRLGLPPRHDAKPETPLHGAGLLLRGDPMLEHPAAELPPDTWHVGPCDWSPTADPAELATLEETLVRRGKPVVYAHLGRTFGGEGLWPRLNAAFRDGPLQAVVERGRSGAAQADPESDLVVVHKPWLAPLVQRSELVITSGTSAPTLAALQYGRPLVMAPAGSEQPVLTRACIRAGVAVELPATENPQLLQDVLDRVRTDAALAAAGAELADRLRAAPGVTGAADFVRAAGRVQPVSSELAG